MNHDYLVEFLLKKVGEIVCDARGPHRNISDELAVKTIRALITPPRAQTAFDQANDTVQAFVMRSVNRALLSNSKTPPRVLVNELQGIMSDYSSFVSAYRTGNVWPKKWRG
jgi:hypothetical protein